MRSKRTSLGVAAMFAIPGWTFAQERPLSVDVLFSTGYYSTYTRDTNDRSLNFVPFGAKFDINGYWMMPDFLSFTAQPELNAGPQASDAGFLGGNGIRFNVTFLRKRIFPLTFHYTNVQMENVTFGGIGQVASYSLKDRNKDMGLTWQIRPRVGLPELLIDWDRMSVNATSDSAFITDSRTSGNHLSADTKWERWGWNFAGQARRQQFETDLFTPLGVGTNTSTLGQTLTQYQASAERTFWKGSSFLLSGGQQSTSSILLNEPFDLSARYAQANLRLVPGRRWKNYVRASYSSNLTSALVNQIVAGLGTGLGTVAPDQTLLAALHGQVSNLTVNATSNFEIGGGFGLYASVDEGQVASSNQQGSDVNARFFTAAGGVTYSKRLPVGNVSAQYARDFGYGSAIGQSGTIQGDNYNVSFEAGTLDHLEANVSVHGNSQSIRNVVPLNGRNFSADASVARRVAGSVAVRLGGGWQTGTNSTTGNEFTSHGFTGRFAVEHPRIQVSLSLNQTLANTSPIYSQLLGVDPTAALLLGSLNPIPSDFRGASIAIHAVPMRKVELSITWTQSRQHLAGIVNNDLSLLDARATYHFRKLQFDAGLIRTVQLFSNYPTTSRGRYYVRISRPAKIY